MRYQPGDNRVKADPARAKAQAARSQERTIRELLGRIASIQTNAGHLVRDTSERLLGAEHALLAITGKKNYLMPWLDGAEKMIREYHAQIRPDCKCGVCRRG